MTNVNDEYENLNQKNRHYFTKPLQKDTHTARGFQIENELHKKMEDLVGKRSKSTFVNHAIRHYFSYLEQFDDEDENKDYDIAIENF